MPKWDVYGTVTGSKYMGQYEAETKDDAIQKACNKESGVHLCHHCSRECSDAEINNITATECEEDEKEK